MSDEENIEETTTYCVSCNWAEIGECRHPEWFDTANPQTQAEYESLKNSCGLCLLAFIGRAINLLSVRAS